MPTQLRSASIFLGDDSGLPDAGIQAEATLNRPGNRGGSNSREWSHEEVPEVFARGA